MQNSAFKIQNGAVALRAGLFAFCILQLAVATACAKADAANLVPDGPPLAMSAPPPRVITPMEVAVAPEPPPDPEPPAAPPEGATASRPAARQPQPKPAATPAEAAATTTAPPAPPPPAAPTLEVRSVPSAAAAAEEKKVRDVMGRAWTDLMTRVNYQRLSNEGRAQYEQAKRFHEQADEALKEKNFILAMTLADKAAQLAAELAGR